MSEAPQPEDRTRRPALGAAEAARIGLVAAICVLLLRLVAWWFSGSVAVLADTLDPLLNVIAAGLTVGSVVGARRPPDARHPYGHRALEHVAAGAQGALALGGAGVVSYFVWRQLAAPSPTPFSGLAVGTFALSLAVNLAVGYYQSAAARRHASPALSAAAEHAYLDVVVGLGVLASLLLVSLLGLRSLDVVVSVVLLVLVARQALRILRRSALGLLDTSDQQARLRATEALSAMVGHKVVGYHDVRCRDSGGLIYVDFHLQFADGVSLEAAHGLAEQAERAVEAAIGPSQAIAHLETEAEVRPDRDHVAAASGPTARQRLSAGWLSLVVALGLMAIKLTAAALTGSAAILSDGLESIVNVVGAAFALFSLRLAASGTDAAHPFGHHKTEYLSAGFEGSLIGVAGLIIIFASVARLMNGSELANLDAGTLLLLVATAINYLLGRHLLKTGRDLRSLTLEADGKHVLTDVWTSVGVLLGLIVVRFTGWSWADPVVAIIVALGILRTSYELVSRAILGVLDTVEPELVARATAVLDRALSKGAIVGWHDLRVRDNGHQRFADAHVQLAEGTSLGAAHDLSEVLEAELAEALAPAEAVLHAEPAHAVRDSTYPQAVDI